MQVRKTSVYVHNPAPLTSYTRYLEPYQVTIAITEQGRLNTNRGGKISTGSSEFYHHRHDTLTLAGADLITLLSLLHFASLYKSLSLSSKFTSLTSQLIFSHLHLLPNPTHLLTSSPYLPSPTFHSHYQVRASVQFNLLQFRIINRSFVNHLAVLSPLYVSFFFHALFNSLPLYFLYSVALYLISFPSFLGIKGRTDYHRYHELSYLDCPSEYLLDYLAQ